MKVAFTCRKNLGKSQQAEIIFNHIYKDHKAISFALVKDVRHENNGVMHPMVADIATEKGIKPAKQHINLLTDFTKCQLDELDFIIILEKRGKVENEESDYTIGSQRPIEVLKNRYKDKVIFKPIEIKADNLHDALQISYKKIEELVKNLNNI